MSDNFMILKNYNQNILLKKHHCEYTLSTIERLNTGKTKKLKQCENSYRNNFCMTDKWFINVISSYSKYN